MRHHLTAALLLLCSLLPAYANYVEKRVQFAKGASSATLTGNLDQAKVKHVGEFFDRYILGARKGQTMTVKVEANHPVMAYVWHHDYNQGSLGYATGASFTKSFQLPADDDYKVDVNLGEGSKNADYTLTVSIH